MQVRKPFLACKYLGPSLAVETTQNPRKCDKKVREIPPPCSLVCRDNNSVLRGQWRYIHRHRSRTCPHMVQFDSIVTPQECWYYACNFFSLRVLGNVAITVFNTQSLPMPHFQERAQTSAVFQCPWPIRTARVAKHPGCDVSENRLRTFENGDCIDRGSSRPSYGCRGDVMLFHCSIVLR